MNTDSEPISAVPSLSRLRAASAEQRRRLGCVDTLREILQQPATWHATGGQLPGAAAQAVLAKALADRPDNIVLTGSGSSLYVGECLAPALQARLGIACRAVAAGTLLVERQDVLPPGAGLLVSIARSGNSPESIGVVDAMLAEAPRWRHLAVTCNAEGGLATRYRKETKVSTLLLADATNDRSLVMTSSSTNLVLAGSGLLPEPVDAEPAAAVAEALFTQYGDTLAAWGARPQDAIVYLGDGASWGAAREAALKMLEMSAGALRVMAETSLGMRHGPMAWLRRDSTLVSFLSGDASLRAYQIDLLGELTEKRLARHRIVVGEKLDPAYVGPDGLALELAGLYALPAPQQAMIHIVVGQLLAFFQSLAQGQAPDAPSQGTLTRVVKPFPLHRRPAA
ncbi:MAG TPA: tagatose-6-phosphate ketose isomerase [Rhodanobacteraceae bacterium]|nr:tagatose-6-phosphate ketose isomerase [Rhodanobacteraceae bacterium]